MTTGRVALLGPRLVQLSATLIDLPPQGRSSRVFFEHSPTGVRNLYFETSQPQLDRVPPALPDPLSQHPRSTPSESFFYSTANLENVERITPCLVDVNGKLTICGLLLQDSAGRNSCVGQIRLDRLGSPIQLTGHQSLWLGFSKDDHRPFVSTLLLSRTERCEGLSWLEVQLYGSMEWWYSARQCQVHHMGTSSPPTRL